MSFPPGIEPGNQTITGTLTVNGLEKILANSASSALTITQTGVGNVLLVEDTASPDPSPLVIDTNGAVAIGYTVVVGTGPIAVTPKLQLHGTNNNSASIGLFDWSATPGGTAVLQFERGASGVINTRALLSTSGATMGMISWSGDDATNFVESCRIEGALDSTGSAGIMPGRFLVSTANASGVMTERLRINSTGTMTVTAAQTMTGAITALNATAIPAGGTAGAGLMFSSTANLGIFFGSSAPTLSAAQGSIYIRTDGSTIATRLYVNTNGSTTWANFVSAA